MFRQRICDFTNTPISSIDRASVQLTFAELDDEGKPTGEIRILDCCGKVRKEGKVDEILYEMLKE